MKPDLAETLTARDGLPDALRVLLEEFPREVWHGHRNFHDHLAFWLDRHLMFRRLVGLLTEDAQAGADGNIEAATFNQRLARLGSHLISDLHAHHTIEDRYFFPMLAGLDARITAGFDLLEADHAAIDPALSDFAAAANAALQGGDAAGLLDPLAAIEALLDRHLSDEEDLIVPLVLKTGKTF